jgi:parvulin-like peptidyl-prolyl isomerase
MPSAVQTTRWLSPALLLLTLLLGDSRAQSASPVSSPSPAASELPGPPLSIDGEQVPWSDFAGWLVLLQGRSNLERFALDRLAERAALEAGVRLKREELLRRIDEEIELRVQTTFGGDRAKWLDELTRLGQTPEALRTERLEIMRRQALTNELVRRSRVVSPEQIRELWEGRYGPEGRRLRVSRLFLQVDPPEQPPGTSREEAKALGELAQRETLKRAEDLHARLVAGADFSQLVREFSNDMISRPAGGRLDKALEPADWPGLERKDLRGKEVGALLPPFYSRGGYNLLRVDAVELTPLETVAATLERELADAPADALEAQALNNSFLDAARLELLAELDREVALDAERLARPVLMINGEAVSRSEYARWLMRARGRPLLRTFMQHRRVAALAAAAGLEPTSVEIEQRVQVDLERQLQIFFQGDRQAWLDDLRASGGSVESFLHVARQRTRHNLRAERLLLAGRVITPELLRATWEERYGEGGQSLDVRYILHQLPPPPEDSVGTEEELAAYVERETRVSLDFLAGLRERVQNGEDFGALARIHSQDPESRDLGGRQPGLFELHTWPQDVQAKLRALTPGGVTEPVQLGKAFFLFELAGRVHVALEDVEDELREELRTRRPSQVEVSGYVNQLTSEVVVEALPGLYE